MILLLYLLILLFKKTLLQPFFEQTISILLLMLLLKAFEFVSFPLFMAFSFLLLSLTFLPISKGS
jgi:hypothetical protein